MMRREAQRQQEQQTNKRFTETKEKCDLQRNAWCTPWPLVHLSSLSWARACICDVGKHGRFFQYAKRLILLSLPSKAPVPTASVSLPMMLESDNLPSKKKKMKKMTTTKKKIGVEASEQGISSAEGIRTTDRRFYFSCLPQERKIQQQTKKEANNINQSAAALYSTRKRKMSNVYLLVCPKLKEVCKTRIITKFRARITYKVDKTGLLFDHLLFLFVVFDRDLLPLVLSAASSSFLLSSAVPNLSLRSQPVSQQLLNRSLH